MRPKYLTDRYCTGVEVMDHVVDQHQVNHSIHVGVETKVPTVAAAAVVRMRLSYLGVGPSQETTLQQEGN